METPSNNLANLSAYEQNLNMMKTIADNNQSLDDIKMLTSSKVTDQLKVFLVAQARNELTKVIKLTQFLDKLEDNFINKVGEAISDDELTIKQYSDVIEVITNLLTRSSDIISKVIKDDSLTTILNTTIYTTEDGTTTQSSVVTQLKDAQSRDRVRSLIQAVLLKTSEFDGENIPSNNEDSNKIIIDGEADYVEDD